MDDTNALSRVTKNLADFAYFLGSHSYSRDHGEIAAAVRELCAQSYEIWADLNKKIDLVEFETAQFNEVKWVNAKLLSDPPREAALAEETNIRLINTEGHMTLRDQLDSALSQAKRVIRVSGPKGIGKSMALFSIVPQLHLKPTSDGSKKYAVFHVPDSTQLMACLKKAVCSVFTNFPLVTNGTVTELLEAIGSICESLQLAPVLILDHFDEIIKIESGNDLVAIMNLQIVKTLDEMAKSGALKVVICTQADDDHYEDIWGFKRNGAKSCLETVNVKMETWFTRDEAELFLMLDLLAEKCDQAPGFYSVGFMVKFLDAITDYIDIPS